MDKEKGFESNTFIEVIKGVDFIAASFIRTASDVLEIRKILEDNGADIHIISKIENQEGGLTSHAAVVGIRISLGIPVIVGVPDAMQVLEDDLTVTIDTPRGVIYKGVTKAL